MAIMMDEFEKFMVDYGINGVIEYLDIKDEEIINHLNTLPEKYYPTQEGKEGDV